MLLFTHPACLDHDTGPDHPERPARLSAVLDALAAPAFALERREAPRVERADLLRVHPDSHIDFVLDAVPARGLARIDGDTILSAGSGEAALRAAGAVTAAVDAVLGGESRRAFCAVRPPGHHAERRRAMGFCLFNSVAVGARRAQAVHGLTRVAIVDFDVHHGNGTQEIFWDDPTVFYASTHQWPLYPGTGAASERGAGTILNLPLPAGTAGPAFRAAVARSLLPALEAFAPELLMISAGFDAHRRDPLAGLALVADDFAWITRELAAIAQRTAGGRIVSVLEGGYDLGGLAESVAAHVGALMEGYPTGIASP